jgi:cytochrome P450
MMSKALSEQKLRNFEPILLSHVDVFLKVLLHASQASKPANMSDRCKRLGLEVMGKFSFGYNLKVQTEETNSFIVKGLEGGGYRNNIYIQAPGVRWLGVELMFKILFLRLFKLRMQYYYWLRGVVKQRLTEGEEATGREDFFSYVVNAKDPETGTTMSITELCSEATFFFPAGTSLTVGISQASTMLTFLQGGDTTATTLTAAFFYLSRNPESYSKLVSEVRSKFSSSGELQAGPLLSSCNYLCAVIDESMRLSPPVAGTLWRELPLGSSTDSLIVDGHVVPAGTWVGVNTYAIHHTKNIFLSHLPSSLSDGCQRMRKSNLNTCVMRLSPLASALDRALGRIWHIWRLALYWRRLCGTLILNGLWTES